MRYRVLGEVDVVVDGEVHRIGSRNQRCVLAALLAHRDAVVSTSALVGALWDDDPPASAVSTLRTYVSRLRRLVGTDLVAEVNGYRLSADPSDVDATSFEQRLDEATSASPARAVELIDAALAMWRGPAFGDHADVPLVLGAARRLEELRVGALESRVEALLAAGNASKAVADATALVVDHSRRERAWIALVDALVTVGRSADAAQAAARARAALAEAGLEPGVDLRSAEARALGIVPESSGVVATPTVDLPAAQPITRSGRPSSFVGRERQLDDLADLLLTAPVVTLVGPGGVGKTRLAVELAARVASRHRLGARIVELGTLTEPEEVAAAVASGLRLTVDRTSYEEALANAGDLDMVAVIDNAEHVVGAAAGVVELLASAGGSMRVVVTSRERLAVDGEHVRAVRPLAADAATSPAQTLLRDRAVAAGAVLVDDDEEAITRIVRRLDGLPLAIEMAAAQLTSCSLAELLATLDERLDDLDTTSSRVPPRHQSLGALIDWSLDELADAESTLLHRLTVFAGSFAADDVAGVLGADSVAATRRLADRSLVAASIASGRTSFRVLHVMRERILRRLGPVTDDVRAAHARWYLSKARSAVAELMGSDERGGRDTVVEILDELRAAHRWAAEHDRPLALALSATVHPFAHSSLNDEVLSWADRLNPGERRPGDDHDDMAVVMASSAARLLRHGHIAASAEMARDAIAVAEHAAARLPGLEALADATLDAGLLDESEAAYQALVDDASEVGNIWYASNGAAGVLLVAAYGGRAPSRSLDPVGLDALAPPSSRAWLAYAEAEFLAATDPSRADELYRDALASARSAANRYAEGVSLASLAAHQCKTGDPTALATFRAAIELWLDAIDQAHQITTLRNLAVLFRSLDLPLETAHLLGGLEARQAVTYGSELAALEAIDRWLAETLPPDTLAAARAGAHHLSVADLARWALATIDRLAETPT